MRAIIIAASITSSICVTGCVSREHNYSPKAGYVPDEPTAVRIAEAVWIPIYGEAQLATERPFRAELRDHVWYVSGTMPPPPGTNWTVWGGVAEASIDRRTGKILRISHSE